MEADAETSIEPWPAIRVFAPAGAATSQPRLSSDRPNQLARQQLGAAAERRVHAGRSNRAPRGRRRVLWTLPRRDAANADVHQRSVSARHLLDTYDRTGASVSGDSTQRVRPARRQRVADAR